MTTKLIGSQVGDDYPTVNSWIAGEGSGQLQSEMRGQMARDEETTETANIIIEVDDANGQDIILEPASGAGFKASFTKETTKLRYGMAGARIKRSGGFTSLLDIRELKVQIYGLQFLHTGGDDTMRLIVTNSTSSGVVFERNLFETTHRSGAETIRLLNMTSARFSSNVVVWTDSQNMPNEAVVYDFSSNITIEGCTFLYAVAATAPKGNPCINAKHGSGNICKNNLFVGMTAAVTNTEGTSFTTASCQRNAATAASGNYPSGWDTTNLEGVTATDELADPDIAGGGYDASTKSGGDSDGGGSDSALTYKQDVLDDTRGADYIGGYEPAAGGVELTGASASVGLAGGDGSASVPADLAGATGTVDLTAGTGTAEVPSDLAGASGSIGLTGGDGALAVPADLAGATGTVSLQGVAGAASVPADLQGESGAVGLQAGTGDVDAGPTPVSLQGESATVGLAGGTGAIVPPTVDLAGVSGTVSATANTGTITIPDVAVNLFGATAVATLSGQVGGIDVEAILQGVEATVTLVGGQGLIGGEVFEKAFVIAPVTYRPYAPFATVRPSPGPTTYRPKTVDHKVL